jgi:prepilin-type processing-associated H-X9-DG protein
MNHVWKGKNHSLTLAWADGHVELKPADKVRVVWDWAYGFSAWR